MASSESPGSIPSIIFRLGLAVAGGVCISSASAVAGAVSLPHVPTNVLLLIAVGTTGLFALAAAAVRRPPQALRWLILSAYLLQVLIPALLWVQSSGLSDLVSVDVGLNSDVAGRLIQHGQDPYTWDYSGVDELFRISIR